MPAVDSKPPNRRRAVAVAGALLALLAVGLVAIVFLRSRRAPASSPGDIAEAKPSIPQPATNLLEPVRPVAPGTVVSAQEVLSKLESWLSQHPNCHAVIETSVFGGGVVSKTELFMYTNAASGATVKVKADVFLPQPMQFQAQNENGRLQVYLPRSDQLIEPDVSSSLMSMPGLTASPNGVSALMKLATNTFAEASADLRVATLVINAEALKLPFMAGDIYLSFRTDLNGQLLAMEEQAQGTRVISTMRYVTFDRDVVRSGAPSFPSGKVAAAGKSLQQALQEEARLTMNRPLQGNRI